MNLNPEKLNKIIELDSEFNAITDLDILLERILLESRLMANADAGSIYIRDNNKLNIRFAQNDTKQQQLLPGHKLIYTIFSVDINDKTMSGFVAATGQSLNIADVHTIPKTAPYHFDPEYDHKSGYKTVSSLTVPLKAYRGEVLGVLQIINAKNKTGEIIPFNSEAELFVRHFAANAAAALHRAIITRALIMRMMTMARMRDPHETGPHVNRVAGFAVEIYDHWAINHGVSETDRNKIRDIFRTAAMLHDVGKVAISDTILKKPGRLTPEEFEIMSTHTFQGAQIFIDKQSEFDEMAADVALSHHENWDGSGYPGYIDMVSGQALVTETNGKPNGRRGEEISIFGRITAIADVYDALRSTRVYKMAWTEETVLAEIKKLSGTKFDPELVDIFFKLQPQLKQIADKYTE